MIEILIGAVIFGFGFIVFIFLVPYLPEMIINFWVKYPDSFSDAKKWVPVIALLLPLQDLVNNDLFTLRALFKNKAFAYLYLAM